MPVNYLVLKSVDRKNKADEPSKCQFQLNKPLKNVSRIELQRLIFFRSHYNISASLKNNIFKFDSTTLTIPDGIYATSELFAYIKAQVEAVTGGTFNMTLSTDYIVNVSATPSITLDFTVVNNMSYDLGFEEAIYSGTTIDAPWVLKINSFNEIYFSFSNLPDIIESTDTDVNDYGTFMVLHRTNKGTYIEYNSGVDELQEAKIDFKTFNTFNVTVKGRKDRLLENMSDWIMKLRVEYFDVVP